MKIGFTYDEHYLAGVEWESQMLKNWLLNVFEASNVQIQKRCTAEIRAHVENEFVENGWAINVELAHSHGLTVFAQKHDLAFQLQTGNMSRAPYDLLKLQYLFQSNRICAAAIGLPTKDAAKKMGDNLANAERVIRELELFRNVITVPILVLAFE